MPKAKLHRGHRKTSPPQLRNHRKENGRPKQTFKRFAFEETRLGFFLKYEVPVVYDILRNLTPPGPFFEPPYLMVKKVCSASRDESFRKPKFQRYLQQYKHSGLYCHQGVKITPRKEAYYKGIRERKLQKFIARNRTRIETLRKISVRTSSTSEPKRGNN